MKISVVLILAFCLQVSAKSDGQTISLTVKNGRMENVLKDIRRQSGFDIVYTTDILKNSKPVNIQLKNADIKSALDKCFFNQPLTYSIISNVVVIKLLQESKANVPRPDIQANIDVQGKVLNENGEPVVVSVMVKETSQGTSTNDQGEFGLKDVSENATLVITGVTIEKMEVKVASRSFISIKVKTKITTGEEVVVSTGYAQMQKIRMTGAASSIGREKYDQRVAVTGNFAESLEGKIPGLVVNNQTGAITIRGISTFDAVKQPLIVVDGFPTEIDIRTINPNDIISVNVLKDAAAASIYGARASNGVIIIETKRGKSGAPVFNFRATMGYQAKPDFDYLKYGSALEYAKIQEDYTLLSGQSRTTFNNAKAPVSAVQNAVFDFKQGLITKIELDNRINGIGAYDNLKQYSDLFYRRRLTSNLDFDVSGGTEKNTYLLGVNYIGQELQNVRNDNQSFLLNFASTHKFTDRIKFDFRAIYSNYKSTDGGNTSSVNDFFNTVSVNKFYPYQKLADQNGNALPVATGPNRNPYTGILAAANETNMALGLYDQFYYPYQELFANTNTTKTSAIRFQGRLNAKLTNWLSLDLGGVFEDQPTSRDLLQTDQAFAVKRLLNYRATKDPVTGSATFSDLPQGDFLTRVNQKTSDYTIRGQFNVNYHSPDFKHSITAIAGSEVRKTTFSSYTNTFFGYDGQSLIVRPVNFVKLASPSTPAFSNLPTLSRPTLIYDQYFGEAYDDRRFISFYGDGNYVYNEKYGLSGSFRLDKTNLFGTDPKFRNKPFYSVGANWIVSREDFMSSLVWLNELKLRVAYGVNGNVPTSNNGPFLILNSGLNYDVYPFPQYYDVLSPQNQSLRWEKTKNTNVGIDYAMFKNRLFGSVDYYYKNSEDVFGQYSSDPTSGFNEYNANTASILNKGLELSINSINVSGKHFSWQTQLTGSFNNNKVTKVKTVSSSTTGLPLVSILNVQKGYPINALFAYDYAGLNDLGIPQIYGADGKPKVISSSASGTGEVALQDLKYMGTTTPKYVVGLNNQFTFGNFDLSFLFMYYGGYVTRVEAPDPIAVNQSGRVLQGAGNYWKKPGDEANTDIPGFPVINTPGYFDTYARLGYNYASKFVRKADNIRLRDVVITYNLNSAAIKKLGLSRTQLRAQIQNAFNYTFSGNDIDPDAINRVTGIRTFKAQPFFSLSLYTNF